MSSPPFEWIRLELIPLPGAQDWPSLVLWWNPEARTLEGEGHARILTLVQAAIEKGSLHSGSGSHIEITDPLHQPSELAAVLAQYYWVIPQPVTAPGEEAVAPILN